MARTRQRASVSASARTRAPQTAKPRTDIYTGLLVVSLLAQIAGAVFLYYDYDRFKSGNPPTVKSDLPPAGANTTPGPNPAPAGNPAPPPG